VGGKDGGGLEFSDSILEICERREDSCAAIGNRVRIKGATFNDQANMKCPNEYMISKQAIYLQPIEIVAISLRF